MVISTITIIVIILVLVGIVLAVAYPQAAAQKKQKVERAHAIVHKAVLEVVKNREEVDNPDEPGKLKLSTACIKELLADKDFNEGASKDTILTVVKYKDIVEEISRTGKVTRKKTGELAVKCKTLEEIGGVHDFDDITFLVENELRKYLGKVEKERVRVEKVR